MSHSLSVSLYEDHYLFLFVNNKYFFCEINNDDCLLVEFTNKSNNHAIAFRSWLQSSYSSNMLDKIIETGKEIVIDWPKNTDIKPAKEMKKILTDYDSGDWELTSVKVLSSGGIRHQFASFLCKWLNFCCDSRKIVNTFITAAWLNLKQQMTDIDLHGKLQISKSQRHMTKKKIHSELVNEKSKPEMKGKPRIKKFSRKFGVTVDIVWHIK